MGLLDSVLGSLSQGGSGSGGNPLLETVLSMVNNPETGGLAGLLQKLQEHGLGNVADSWVSTGKIMPISGDQLQEALGSGALGDIASKLGLSTNDVSSQLADLLPGVVDNLTPNGQLPDMGSLGDLLGSLTKRLG
jgi:uncharacterized protein YidB (DUF937 family)